LRPATRRTSSQDKAVASRNIYDVYPRQFGLNQLLGNTQILDLPYAMRGDLRLFAGLPAAGHHL